MVLTERDKQIIYEVSRWKCILGRQIRILNDFSGGRATDRRLKKLIDEGYLLRKRYIYGIAGILSVTNKSKTSFDIKLPINEPRLDQIEHDIAVVDTAIYFVKNKGIKLHEITTEKQFRNKLGFIQREHIPDFTYTINDKKYCVEVELNQKAKDRLEKNIKQNYMNYDVQNWIIPEGKIKIKELVSDNSKKYPNVEIIELGVISEFIKSFK